MDIKSITQFLALGILLISCCLTQSGCLRQDSCERKYAGQQYNIIICEQKAGAEKKNGESIIPARFDEINYLESPVFRQNFIFPIANKTSFTLSNGSVNLHNNKQYADGATDPIEVKNLFLVRQNNLWAVFDEKGNALTGFNYEQISHYDYSNYLLITKHSLRGLLNLEGKEVIKPQYEAIEKVDQGFLRITKNRKTGIYDNNLKLIIEPKYNHLLSAWEAFHSEYPKFNFFRNTHWFEVGGIKYFKQNYSLFSTYFWFVKNGKHGLIDISGQEITNGWDGMGYVIDGLIMVAQKKDNRTLYGLIDLKGNIVTPVKYSSLNPTKDKGYVALTNELMIRLDKSGQEL